jgi:hypothetical protein
MAACPRRDYLHTHLPVKRRISDLHRDCTVSALSLSDPGSVALEVRRNCISASWEKGWIPNVMAGMERKMPEKREAGHWTFRMTAMGACEPTASSRWRQPNSRTRSLTARTTSAQFPGSPSDMRVPPRSTSTAEASRSLRDSACKRGPTATRRKQSVTDVAPVRHWRE